MLLMMVGASSSFEIAVSVPLVLEYEAVLKRQAVEVGLSYDDIDDIIDYLCSVARRTTVFFLWRPTLRDPKDDFVLELAVNAECDAIVTYNTRDFRGAERFGIRLLTPKDLLQQLGAIS